MKKLITLITAVVLMLPQQALCLRPITVRNSDGPVNIFLPKIDKTKKGRPSKHPGNERLRQLIQKHLANAVKIAAELKVSQSAVLRWINSDTKLMNLAKELREKRPVYEHGLSKHPGNERLKQLIQEHLANTAKIAAELKVTRAAVSTWINSDTEFMRLAEELRKKRPVYEHGLSKHPGNERLKQLIQRHFANAVRIAAELKVSQSAVLRWINSDTEFMRLAKELRKMRNFKEAQRLETALLTAA